MKIIKPRKLRKGDWVGLISPASATADVDKIAAGIKTIKSMGYKVEAGRYSREELGFLAGEDNKRLHDLHSMFKNKRIKAIICFRGGYGSGRLLRQINYDLIRKNPKILVGFSDITALHLAIMKKTGLVTFHGPMVSSNLVKKDCPEYTVEGLFRCISRSEPLGSILPRSTAKKPQIINKGVARGRITGGNLSIVVATLGTPFEIETKGKIVILEEIDERTYRVDRMLTHLLNAGKLGDAAGIAVGINVSCKPQPHKNGYYMQTVEDVFIERLKGLKIPLVMGLPFGHIKYTATIPMGVKATLDANRGDLIIEEAAVV